MSNRFLAPAYSPSPLRQIGAAAFFGNSKELEAVLRRSYAAKHAYLVDSGTSALSLAIRHAGQLSGRPCLLPAFGCYDLVSAALGGGVPFQFYDVDPHSLCPDWGSLERGLARGASSIVVVHQFGVPVDMERAGELALQSNALLIEDAAQAVGGRIGGLPLGSFGDFSVLSFGRGKGLTGGGGGALLSRGRAGAVEVKVPPEESYGIASLISAAAQQVLSHPHVYGIPARLPFLKLGETHFLPPTPPRGIRRTSAALVIRNLKGVAPEAAIRRGHASAYINILDQKRIRPVFHQAASDAGWLRFPLIMPPHLQMRTKRELGIVRSYPMPLHELTESAEAKAKPGDYPGASVLAERLVTIPTHSRLSPVDLQRITAWLTQLPL